MFRKVILFYPLIISASIFNFRSSFANCKNWAGSKWFYFFLSNLYHTITCGSANAQLKTYPLDNLGLKISFDPLMLWKISKNTVVIKDQELTYAGTTLYNKTSRKLS